MNRGSADIRRRSEWRVRTFNEAPIHESGKFGLSLVSSPPARFLQ